MNFLFQRFAKLTRNPLLIVSKPGSPVAYFHSGIVLCAEPMKKKKKLDPALIRAREERKRKRLEKSIKKLEKCTKQLKPLEETLLPPLLKNETVFRRRLWQAETEEQFVQSLKAWADYCNKKASNEEFMFQRIFNSQAAAMKELKIISIDLYAESLRIDESLVPYVASGPKTTAPVHQYTSPDGEWIDESQFK